MKGYYLFAPYEESCLGPGSGVEKKVRAQHLVLSSICDCELSILPPVRFQNTTGERIIRRLPYTASWNRWDYRGEFDDADFLYMRMVHHDQSLIRYLRAIRSSNPKIKILYEVPTYPMGKYRFSFNSVSFDLKEFFARKQLHRYVDRIITFYGQSSIWDVPCIALLNGYDFSQIQLPQRSQPEAVHLLSVAAVSPIHGYERLLEGFHRYYANGGTEAVFYHYVGPALPEHRRMAKEYGLEDRVIFHGPQYGEDLRSLFAQCTLGVDVLGGYKANYTVSSSLKSREYAAYGLPILTAAPIDYQPEAYPYTLLIPNDPSPVEIPELLQFWHGIYDSRDVNQLARQIREEAVSRCDMRAAMQPVLDWLRQNCQT